MNNQLKPPEELARANPTTLTALWRVIQIDKDEDRFEQAEIYLDSDSLDTTGIEIVADAMRERFNEHSELRAEVVKQRRRKQEIEAEAERLRDVVDRCFTALHDIEAAYRDWGMRETNGERVQHFVKDVRHDNKVTKHDLTHALSDGGDAIDD